VERELTKFHRLSMAAIFILPLCHSGLANTYSLFAEAADTCEEPNPSLPQQTHTMSRKVNAMVGYPEMLAGENHFCTSLGRTFGNHLASRLGADGCYGFGIRASEQTEYLGARGFIGVAVKVEDGSVEIACAVVPKLLERLQMSTVGMREKLRDYRCSERSNTAEVVTGKAHHPLVLLKTPTLSPALDSRGHSG